MKSGFGLVAAFLALALTTLTPAQACNDRGNCADAPGQNKNVSGAPGPIAGAGLPLFAVGFGVYWLVKRRRKTTD
jgi:hypothetical protein